MNVILNLGTLFYWLSFANCTPILSPLGQQNSPAGIGTLQKHFCFLPPEYSGKEGGKAKFLEDCKTLGKTCIEDVLLALQMSKMCQSYQVKILRSCL